MRATVAESQGRCRETKVKGSSRRPLDCRNTNGQRVPKAFGNAASRLGMAKSQAHQGASGRARQPEGTDPVLTWGDLGAEWGREVSRGHSVSKAIWRFGGVWEKDRRVTAEAIERSRMESPTWNPERQVPASSTLRDEAPGPRRSDSPVIRPASVPKER